MSEVNALSKRVVIILVEPQHSGNIGAAARAMHNMGLEQLTLVSPCAFDPLHAQWLSPGCDDILKNMRIVSSLEEALTGVHRVIASTARHRKNRQPVHSPKMISRQVLEAPDGQVTGILFGREDFGLSKEAVHLAEAILQIPTAPHASLNLSQAVMVVCYALFQEFQSSHNVETGRLIHGRQGTIATSSLHSKSDRDIPADWTAMESAVQALVSLLDQVGYTEKMPPTRIEISARQAMQSTHPSVRQIDILRGMIGKIRRALDSD